MIKMEILKIRRIIIAGLLTSILFFVAITSSFAADMEVPIEEQETPRYEVVCGGLSFHRMMSHGGGIVYYANGTTYINSGCAWECRNCGLVMVTEGDILPTGTMSTIGKYAIVYHPENPITNIIIIMPADYYGYTSSNSLQGFRFFV